MQSTTPVPPTDPIYHQPFEVARMEECNTASTMKAAQFVWELIHISLLTSQELVFSSLLYTFPICILVCFCLFAWLHCEVTAYVATVFGSKDTVSNKNNLL